MTMTERASTEDASVTVRPATAADVPAIIDVCTAGAGFIMEPLLPAAVIARQSELFYSADRVRREVDPAHFSPEWQGYLVAELAGRVIGAAGGGMIAEGIGCLYVIFLDLDVRRRGIGTLLLDAVTAQQRALGARRQRVHVLAGNHDARQFYEAHGFTQIGQHTFPQADPDGVPELVLERPL